MMQKAILKDKGIEPTQEALETEKRKPIANWGQEGKKRMWRKTLSGQNRYMFMF